MSSDEDVKNCEKRPIGSQFTEVNLQNGSQRNFEEKMEVNLQNGSQFTKWKSIYKMEVNLQNGSQFTKWKSIYKMEVNLQNGSQFTKWKSIYKMDTFYSTTHHNTEYNASQMLYIYMTRQ